MDYSPNFSDPRVAKRVKTAVGFVKAIASTHQEKQLATRFIDKHLGQNMNALSKYLRNKLLICTDEHFSKDKGLCKKYVYSARGVEYLESKVDIPNDIANIWSRTQYQTELKSLEFNYNDKSHRLWNHIQNIRSDVRNSLLAEAGLKHTYDIVCSAPTLLYQHSFCVSGATGEALEHIEYYLAHRDIVRNRIALDLGVDVKIIKQLINSLFCGAVISTSPVRAIAKMFNNDNAKIQWLQQDEFIINLKNDIRTMWQPIKDSMNITPFNSKAKWKVYFQLERQVLDAQKTYMSKRGIKCFLLHDGIFTDKPIDVRDMCKNIKNVTGYEVSLD